VKVELHSIVADCPSCHGTDFAPPDGKAESIRSQALMTCTRCGTRTVYIALLLQIGDKAITRSTETLARIKAQRAKLKAGTE